MGFDAVAVMPYVWLGVFVLAVVVEAMTLGLVTVWAALGALVMIPVANAGMPVRFQVILFLLLTIVLIFTTRPVALKCLKVGKRSKFGMAGPVGVVVRVERDIPCGERGDVRLGNGTVWNATPADGESICSGDKCVVMEVRGNTLVLRKEPNGESAVPAEPENVVSGGNAPAAPDEMKETEGKL